MLSVTENSCMLPTSCLICVRRSDRNILTFGEKLYIKGVDLVDIFYTKKSHILR